MRASDLIGAPVVDADGQELGIVIDLRCRQDGPLRGALQAPRVESVIVSRTHVGSLLGYERRSQQGPWLLRVLVRGLHRHAFLAKWDELTFADGRLTLTRSAQRIPLPED